MFIWNWPFLAAAVLMGVVALVHIFPGGKEGIKPLMQSEDMDRQAKMTLYYAWHLVTAGLIASTLVFLAAALRPEWVAIGWAAGLMVLVFALVSLVQTIAFRLPLTMVPQWMIFGPIAALALWGAS